MEIEFNIFPITKLYNPDNRFKNLVYIWILFSILPFIIFMFSAKIDNSLFLNNGLGLLSDIIFLSYFIFIPLIFSLAIIYFPYINEVIKSLNNVVIIKENSNNSDKDLFTYKDFNQLLNKFRKIINAEGKYSKIKWGLIIGGIGWLLMGANAHWNAVSNYGQDIWSSKNHLTSFVIRTAYEAIIFGILFPLVLHKYLTILYSMKNILQELTERKALKLRPINPDKAGGLGKMGQFSLKLVFFLLSPLIPIFAYIFFGQINIIFLVGLTLYIPLLIFAFFYPLSGAHFAMKKFKEEELNRLSKEFNKVYDEFNNKLRKISLNQLNIEFEVLEKIDALYKKAEKMPVWPFDTETIAKFGSILAAIITSIWLNWLFGKLVQM